MNVPLPARGKNPLKFAALFVVALAFACIFVAPQSARAQNFDDNAKWEFGGHVALLNLPNECTGATNCETSSSGFGANFSYNFSRWVGFDSEMNFFANNGSASTTITGGRVSEGLFGLRFGPTTRKWGFYSVVRPGFITFSRVLDSNLQPGALASGDSLPRPFLDGIRGAPGCTTGPCFTAALGYNRATDFAFNYGEAVEWRPTKHLALRFDIGDTIVSYPAAAGVSPFHQHNFQISQALVIRF